MTRRVSPGGRGRCLMPTALLLAACAAPPAPTPPDGAPPSARPATDPNNRPTTAKDRNAAQQTAAKQSGQVASIGTKPLATYEADMACAKLVAPFDLADNATILAGLGMDGVVSVITDTASQWLQQWSKQPVQKNAVANAKHNISYEMRAAALRMNWLPMQTEVLYGRTILEAKSKAGDIQPRDNAKGRRLYPRAQALLDAALQAVDEPHDYKFEVHVTTSGETNAQALPGGIILIDQGLLVDDREPARKAKFAIGHEVGHILQRHETRAVQARIIDAVSMRGSVADLAKTIRGSRSEPAAVISLVLAGKIQFERHFANQELVADSCGVRIANNMLKNDTQLIAVLNAFIASLPKPVEDNRPDPFVNAKDLTPAAANAAKSLASAQDLMVLVTRPIDQHPATALRLKNLNQTLTDIRKRRDAAAADAVKQKAAGKAGDIVKPRTTLPGNR
jgi:Zn-dependent protease with chaperone function